MVATAVASSPVAADAVMTVVDPAYDTCSFGDVYAAIARLASPSIATPASPSTAMRMLRFISLVLLWIPLANVLPVAVTTAVGRGCESLHRSRRREQAAGPDPLRIVPAVQVDLREREVLRRRRPNHDAGKQERVAAQVQVL